jgi:hypothetical protein
MAERTTSLQRGDQLLLQISIASETELKLQCKFRMLPSHCQIDFAKMQSKRKCCEVSLEELHKLHIEGSIHTLAEKLS